MTIVTAKKTETHKGQGTRPKWNNYSVASQDLDPGCVTPRPISLTPMQFCLSVYCLPQKKCREMSKKQSPSKLSRVLFLLAIPNPCLLLLPATSGATIQTLGYDFYRPTTVRSYVTFKRGGIFVIHLLRAVPAIQQMLNKYFLNE